MPVGNSAGRGLHPRPERSTPAKYSPTLPNSSPPSPCKSSYFLSSVLCSCVDGSFRSGVQPPTGTKSERSPPAGCVGYNPRPSQGPERSPFAGCGMLIIKYRLGSSVRICFCRSATEPVGGFTPDRNDPPPPNICLSSQTPGTLHPRQVSTYASELRQVLPCPTLPISLASPMLLRGWIIPVGGTTPDRHKVGTLPLCWLRGVQPPTGTKSERSPFAKHFPNPPNPSTSPPNTGRILPYAGRQQCRSGVEPPTGTIHPRQIPPYASEFVKFSPTQPFLFPVISPMLLRGWIFPVGGTTRPAQTRPAQGHRLKNDNRHPPPLPQNLPRPL